MYKNKKYIRYGVLEAHYVCLMRFLDADGKPVPQVFRRERGFEGSLGTDKATPLCRLNVDLDSTIQTMSECYADSNYDLCKREGKERYYIEAPPRYHATLS